MGSPISNRVRDAVYHERTTLVIHRPCILSTKYIKETVIPAVERIRDEFGRQNQKDRSLGITLSREAIANIVPVISVCEEVLRTRGAK
jgi:hypothetical protein